MEIINSCSIAYADYAIASWWQITPECVLRADERLLHLLRDENRTWSNLYWMRWISLRNQGDVPRGVWISVQIHRLVRSSHVFRKIDSRIIILYISLNRVSCNLCRILTKKFKAWSTFVFALHHVFDTRLAEKRLDKRRKVKRIHAKDL